MAKFIYTDRKISEHPKQKIRRAVLSLLTGISAVLCLISVFGIRYIPAEAFRGGIAGGLAKVWNDAGRALLLSDGIVLKELAGESAQCGLFLTLCMALFALFIGLIGKSNNPYLLLLPIGLVCFPLLFTEMHPSAYAAAFFLLCIVLNYGEMKNPAGLGLWQTGYIFALLAVCLLCAGLPLTSDLFQRSQAATALDTRIERAGERLYYGEPALGNGALADDRRKTEKDVTALTVKMKNPESTYLRGFVGEVFTRDKWDVLPYGTYADSKNLLHWLEESGFHAGGQISQVGSLFQAGKENAYEIEVGHADKHYAYVPYELSGFAGDGVLNWYNDYYTAGNIGRMKTYRYTAGENQVKQWTDLAGKLFTAEENPTTETYLTAESYYNAFVYQHYTYLSDDEKLILKDFFGDRGNQSEGHVEYKVAIRRIKKYLEEQLLYTEKPMLPRGDGANMLETILTENKGYDVHYATAATLMFRYYGIPARYVEGYLITPEDVRNQKAGEAIAVPESNAHAWTEIYVDGVGFVPIEVTPEYAGVMEEADLSVGLENESVSRQFESSGSSAKQQHTERRGESDEAINKQVVLVVSILLLLIVLLVLAYLLYRLVKALRAVYARKKLFCKSEAKIGVCAIYARMEELGLKIGEAERTLGNQAAYSKAEISEEDRTFMLNRLSALKKEKRADEKRKKKLASRFGRFVRRADSGGDAPRRLRRQSGRKSG